MKTNKLPAVGTGKQAAAALPTQDVTIKQRPVTAAGGLGGIQKSVSRLPTRQNQDASYFFGLLKSKEKDIINEIETLNQKVQNLGNESLAQGNIEVVYQALLKDVRELEGTLADYSVANEKLRQGFDAEEMEIRHVELRMQNEKLSHDLDDIFVTKQQCEKNVQQVEEGIKAMHESIKRRLEGTTDPEVFNDYEKHMVQIQYLQSEEKRIELQLEQMKNNFSRLEALQSNSEGYEHLKLYQLEEKNIEKLKVDLIQIDEDLHIAQLKPEEAKAYLLEKVKSTQARVKDLTKEETDITDEIQKLKVVQGQFQDERKSSASNRVHVGENIHYGKGEGEVDESNNISEETIADLARDRKQKQDQIIALLEDLSKNIKTRDTSKPTEQGLKNLSTDVDFRAKHLVNSQQTMKHLLEQKEKRLREVSYCFPFIERFTRFALL